MEQYSFKQLLALSEEQVLAMRGKNAKITKNDGTVICGKIVNILGAFNPPNLACGFVMADGTEVGFQSIMELEI